jgi:adenosylcobinamide-GDP ribazoletransferase
MRGLILAIQFLTRLPVPPVRGFRPTELAGGVVWFPLVGLLVGAVVAGAAWLGALVDPRLGALLGLLAWVWVTGALHLDGVADLADALGAAHGDRERLLAVLADPHVGAFGVLALIAQVLAKLVLLLLLIEHEMILALPLLAAWARLGPLLWSRLPPLKPGLGERFVWHAAPLALWGWAGLLALASLYHMPALLLAPLLILAWHAFLRARLGGMSGDALGAGVEWTESALLLVLVVHAAA